MDHSYQALGTAIDMLISNDTLRGTFYSPEIISEIISYLLKDKKTLLTLGLVSKQTLYESRRYIFSTVDFFGSDSDAWGDFDRFLRLVDVTWTSFTPTIRCIGIRRAFERDDDDSAGKNTPVAPRIRMNLPNVKFLRLLCLNWIGVPSYIMDLVFQLPIEHLLLDSVYGCNATNLHDLFRRFPPSLRSLDFKKMRATTMPDLSEEPFFHRPFQFETLDIQSLILFESVWDPSICYNLNIKVKSFSLKPVHDQFWWHKRAAPFVSRFLQRVGPSIENLTVSLAPYKAGNRISVLLDSIRVSRCINLRSLDIGELILVDHAPDSAIMIKFVQKLLSALPSPRALQTISITVKPSAPSVEGRVILLESFKWSSLVETVQRLFPNLNELAIHLCTCSEAEDPNQFLDSLRRVANVRDLEEEGVLRLDVDCFHPMLSGSYRLSL